MKTEDVGKKKGLLGGIWKTVSGECGCAPRDACCSPKSSACKNESDGDRGKKTLKIYDTSMCCSSGVCGSNVNSTLVEFAGALKALAKHGIIVERWNLSQQPQAFAENLQVREMLSKLGKDALPFIFVNDELKIFGHYPKTGELFALLGIENGAESSDKCCAKGCCK